MCQPAIGIGESSHGVFERLVERPPLLHLRQDRQRGSAGRDASGVAVFGGQGGLPGWTRDTGRGTRTR
jgi:hypothetical protein